MGTMKKYLDELRAKLVRVVEVRDPFPPTRDEEGLRLRAQALAEQIYAGERRREERLRVQALAEQLSKPEP
jgi:hypothetical protein